jgi:hypothetical protein
MPRKRRPDGGPDHVALLGDSIFDNGAYVRGQPDVVTHLRSLLPAGWEATLCASDGATTETVRAQLATVPAEASRLVMAIGGNDALRNVDLLEMRTAPHIRPLAIFADRLSSFEENYRGAIAEVLRLQRPLTVCTIYNGALDADAARLARVALMMFNDVIVRTAADCGSDIIELRAVCTKSGDYANPIEPSGAGGLKIATAVARAIGAIPTTQAPSTLWR